MKTKKEFLENFANNPELAEKTLKAGQLTWREINEMKWDAYAANTGLVPGMIYYDDTVKFAKQNERLILEQLREIERECGQLDVPRYSDVPTQYYNWLAWFAWENTMVEVLSFIDA
jgi:hypothetical protein